MGKKLRKIARDLDRNNPNSALALKKEIEEDMRTAITRLESDVTLAKETIRFARENGVWLPSVAIVLISPQPAGSFQKSEMLADKDKRGNSYLKDRREVDNVRGSMTVRGINEAVNDAVRQGAGHWSVAIVCLRSGLWEALCYRVPRGDCPDVAEEMGPDVLGDEA